MLSALLTLAACGPDADRGGSGATSNDDPSGVGASAPVGRSDPQWLVEATDDWGVAFEHDAGARGEMLFPEMMGGGAAVFDADGDGDLDLYFVSGSAEADASLATGQSTNRLFLQSADGSFEEATAGSGLDDRGYGTGVAVGDIDNDGVEDVFVSNFGPDRLFRGRGDGTFEEVSAESGIGATGTAPDDWSTSAAFCDVDLDGWLDLYVVRYVVYDPAVRCTDSAGRPEYCGPDSFVDRVDVLLHNEGEGRFRDVSEASGITAATGAGLGVVCADLDEDGWLDLYVANDGDPNQLWINQQDGTFVDDGLIMGASLNAAGLHEAGMGVVAADFDQDADLDLFVTHLRDESNTFYRSLGPGLGFSDDTTKVGLGASSTPFTGFGTLPIDLDLDGDLDLAIVNGRVRRGEPAAGGPPSPWDRFAEPNLIFVNDGGRFRIEHERVAAFVRRPEVGRGLAGGDLDGDGDLDLVETNIGSRSRLYRGEPPAAHWLVVDAVDPTLGRRALGARVTLTTGRHRSTRVIHGAMSYLSSSDPRAYFGLGDDASAVEVEVTWPGGDRERFGPVEVDRQWVLKRGEGRS